MDDAVALIERYLDAERAVVEAVFTAPDDTTVAERRAALADVTLPSDGMEVGATLPARRPGMTAGEVAADNALLTYYSRRPLFAVTRHDHPLWGTVFAAYAGGDQPPTSLSYARLFYLADTERGPRVVAEYDSDPDTDDVQWIHLGGATVDPPGPLVEARRLAEPGYPRDRAHWQSLDAS